MLDAAITFTNLLLAALTAGAMVGIWLGLNPAGLAFGEYVVQQQHAIRRLNVPMPVLGAATAALTVVDAWLAGADRLRPVLLGTAAVCFVAAGAITRLSNQPINAVVMTWTARSAPDGWTQLRDRWWRWHCARTALGVVGLALVILAVVLSGRMSMP